MAKKKAARVGKPRRLEVYYNPEVKFFTVVMAEGEEELCEVRLDPFEFTQFGIQVAATLERYAEQEEAERGQNADKQGGTGGSSEPQAPAADAGAEGNRKEGGTTRGGDGAPRTVRARTH